MSRYRSQVVFDPQIMFEFRPELCPRFPDKRETLSLDAGFAQTPFLTKILSYYQFKASPDLGVVSSKIAPAVVAVSTFFGLERKCDCSGLVIHWSSSEKEATILTSAKLLINPKDSEFEFHLIVRMPDGTLLLAKEEHVDYYYNLLTLKVKPIVEPQLVDLRSSLPLVVDGMEVISLGRSFRDSALSASTGKLYQEAPNFGCGELLTSDCGNHEIGEGGPLVTDAGYVAGINFFDHQCAHPLPTTTILSCLEMLNSYSTVLRPWFGIQVVDVNYLSKLLSIPLPKVTVSNRDFYVFVNEVYEGSVACKSNIGSCDSVFSLNETRIESVKQYCQILSEASRRVAACDSDHRLMAVINPYDRPTEDIIIEADYISVDDKRFSVCWPQVKVDEWLHDKSGLRNPGYHWPPMPDDAMPDDIC